MGVAQSYRPRTGDRVRVLDWPAIACRIVEYPLSVTSTDDPDDIEEELDTERAVIVMVGDDKRQVVDVSDLVPLEEDEYCRNCGQIGCPHG